MLTLPQEIMSIFSPFMQIFSRRIWDWAQVLVIGAILAPGKRTVSPVLHVMGLKDEKKFQNYHRVLNRARWSALAVSKELLLLLVTTFVAASQPIILGGDETMERRWGPKIRAKSIFRDNGRSSKGYHHFTPALRWVYMMLLVKPPWSKRSWGLPFLTVLAPSQKTNEANGQRHKTSIDWLMQMVTVVRRWLPGRLLVLVVDGGLAAGKLGLRCQQLGVIFLTRLRLDARLYAPPTRANAKKGRRLPSLNQVLVGPETVWTQVTLSWYGGQQRDVELCSQTALWATPGRDPLPLRWVLVRDPLGQMQPEAFLSTDFSLSPTQILLWYICRWSVEVTFQEARAHLGMETQRQWSDLAIARTTPALLGLFSLVTLLAHRLSSSSTLSVRTSAWYRKSEATFADALAYVRRYLWGNTQWVHSPIPVGLNTLATEDSFVLPAEVFHGLVDTLCYPT
jgi:hypothetical protein